MGSLVPKPLLAFNIHVEKREGLIHDIMWKTSRWYNVTQWNGPQKWVNETDSFWANFLLQLLDYHLIEASKNRSIFIQSFSTLPLTHYELERSEICWPLPRPHTIYLLSTFFLCFILGWRFSRDVTYQALPLLNMKHWKLRVTWERDYMMGLTWHMLLKFTLDPAPPKCLGNKMNTVKAKLDTWNSLVAFVANCTGVLLRGRNSHP